MFRDRVKSLRRVKASQLADNPRNWKKHPEKQREALKRLLESVGFAGVVLVRQIKGGQLEILDGHLRSDLVKEYGDQKIPVVVLDLNDREAAELLLWFDPLAALAETNKEKLQELMQYLAGDNGHEQLMADLAAAGNVHQLKLAMSDEAGSLDDPPADLAGAAKLVKKWKTKPGQLWEIEGGRTHRLLCGDSSQAGDVRLLAGRLKAKLMSTDPPYGVAYKDDVRVRASRLADKKDRDQKWDEGIAGDDIDAAQLTGLIKAAIAAALPVLTPKAAFYLWGPMIDEKGAAPAAAQAAADHGVLLHRQIIWVKPGMVLGFGDYHWQHEVCLYGWIRGQRPEFLGERNQTTVWQVAHDAAGSDKLHSTQKPIELFARPILNHTRKGDVVYEPFSGSGSQLVAAEQLERRCLAMELEPKFVAVALERMATLGCDCKMVKQCPTEKPKRKKAQRGRNRQLTSTK